MSKASEWAKELKERECRVRTAQGARPTPVFLVLSPNSRIEVRADDDGNPRVKIGHGRDDEAGVEVARLLEFCQAITETFGA